MVIGAVEEMLGGGDVLWKVLNAFVTRYRYRCYSSALFEAEIVSWVRQNQGKKESESMKRFLQTWIHSPGLPQVKAVLSPVTLVGDDGISCFFPAVPSRPRRVQADAV